jgi:hypothetical protein
VGTRVFPTRSGEDLISPKKSTKFSFFKKIGLIKMCYKKLPKLQRRSKKNSTPAKNLDLKKIKIDST